LIHKFWKYGLCTVVVSANVISDILLIFASVFMPCWVLEPLGAFDSIDTKV
jgi:hypothetical protein